MADTGADIMLVTQEFCDNMGLGVGPTKLGIQTSVSRLGGLTGQLTHPFDLVLASGTEFELRIPVGLGTEIGIVGVSQNSRSTRFFSVKNSIISQEAMSTP
jgi:hypothetical protein